MDLVSQTSSISGMKLKIALVATKTEDSKLPQNLKESCKKLLEMTKDHLGSLSPELFLLNEVITTSSQEVTSEILENLRTKIATLCSDGKLKEGSEEMRPFSWHKFLDAASQDLYLSVDRAQYLWEKEKDEVGEAKNISREESTSLLTFQSIVEVMIEEDKAEQNDELKLDSELDTIVETSFELEVQRSKPFSKEKKEQEIPQNLSTKTSAIKENEERGLTNKANKKELQNKNDESAKEGAGGDLVLDQEDERKLKTETQNDNGEVLWFRANENLYDYVITQPTAFVKSLRSVITHKVKDKFKEVRFKGDVQDLLNKGCLSFKVFREAYNSDDHLFTEEDVWMFMKELGLAFPI